MRRLISASFPLFLGFALLLPQAGWCQDGAALELKASGSRLELTWPAGLTNAGQGVVYPEYEVQVSSDLEDWQPFSPKLRASQGRPLSYLLDPSSLRPPRFFRVVADTSPRALSFLADGGAEAFGYNAVLSEELARLGLLSLEDFATNAPAITYLPQLTWDPTTAQFWTNFFGTNVYSIQYGGSWNAKRISYSYQLDSNELPVFLSNGFIVCERMGSPTFGDAYYRLFNADLPVFVTCDSILHAWHKSFTAIIEETEELLLSLRLEKMLTHNTALKGWWDIYGQGPLKESILDADYLLTVARSLLASQQVQTAIGIGEQQVSQTLQDIEAETAKEVEIFGSRRFVDFSQFKVRGHYDASERLRRYFKAMMWLGRTDLRLATFEPNKEDDLRQLGTALVLSWVIPSLSGITAVTDSFFGPTDSMTIPQMQAIIMNSPEFWWLGNEEIPSQQLLVDLQKSLLDGTFGAQRIGSHWIFSPLSPEQVKLARSFTVLGQKFTLDSWAMDEVVFDRVLWDPMDPRTVYGKVIRRKPTSLDVAFAVLGNDQVVPEIVDLIQATNGVRFRDGLPYQHNLLALRRTIERQKPSAWTNTIYSAWLGALRALSAPTTDPEYPEAMRTRAWAMKNLNTQLASWTQLRHDTILYAKQAYTEPLICSYPDGFLEPRPEFWGKMATLAEVAKSALSQLEIYHGESPIYLPSRTDPTKMVQYDLQAVKTNQLAFLGRFSQEMLKLKVIAEKELAQQPFNAEETELFENLVERTVDYLGIKRWNGWYPGLFYTNHLGGSPPWEPWQTIEQAPGCDMWDPLVTDVHTDLPDEVVGDPGAVIHEAVGNVNLMLIAVDNGPDRVIYAGPVFSHYEFEQPIGTRLSDAEWKEKVRAGQQPSPPAWTRSYLVPGTIEIPPGY